MTEDNSEFITSIRQGATMEVAQNRGFIFHFLYSSLGDTGPTCTGQDKKKLDVLTTEQYTGLHILQPQYSVP